MPRRYYSRRKRTARLTLAGLYERVKHTYVYFRGRGYFHQAGVWQQSVSDDIRNEAALVLGFQPFPITKWNPNFTTEDRVFDVIEFLHDHVSKPGEWGLVTDATGWNSYGYLDFDARRGKVEFRQQCNNYLCDYRSGFELSAEGQIRALGRHGLKHILDAEIPAYDEDNVDSKVREAIRKWRNRHLDMSTRRVAIRDMADVFEYLRPKLKGVLKRKDESALFDIANNFAIRHHDPKQKGDYDTDVWYSWMFHFYLATYHAAIRLLKRQRQEETKQEIR